MCTNLGKQPCSEDTYVTERCVKCTQPGHAKDWQTETEVTHSNTQTHGGFTSGHCMYKPGETFSEDTYVTERCVKYKQEAWKTDRQKRKENTLWYHSRPHARGGLTCILTHILTQPGATFSKDTYVVERCVKCKQDTRKTDRQKWKENTLTLTHTRGFYILTQRWGNILRGHIATPSQERGE